MVYSYSVMFNTLSVFYAKQCQNISKVNIFKDLLMLFSNVVTSSSWEVRELILMNKLKIFDKTTAFFYCIWG